MSHRVDVLERDYPPPLAGQPRCIGYGYRFDAELAPELQLALADAKTHSLRLANAPIPPPPAPYLAEVRPRAGVTDNVAQSVLALLANASARHGVEHSVQRVASGRIYALAEAESAAKLYNPIVESIEVLSARAWVEQGFASAIAEVQLPAQPASISIDLDQLDDDQLTELSKLGIDDGQRRRGPLGLSLDDLRCLRAHYQKLNRPIRDIELETFAQSWSEHCKHRFFAASIDEIDEGLFRRYIQSATEQISAAKPGFCLSVFHDNAGAIAFGDHVLAYKVETHNSPSALDPYGGAMTGILGVNRDCLGFGMGAEPIANVFGFCLPHPDDQRQLFRDPELKQPLPSAAELGAGVIRGVEEGGNHSGIPTVQGFVYTHPSFRGKPLVYCGTLGILPAKSKAPMVCRIQRRKAYTRAIGFTCSATTSASTASTAPPSARSSSTPTPPPPQCKSATPSRRKTCKTYSSKPATAASTAASPTTVLVVYPAPSAKWRKPAAAPKSGSTACN